VFSHINASVVAALFVGAAIIIPQQSSSAVSPRVINGTDPGALASSAAYLEIFDGSCTAAVLAPTILVTAAHCVAESDDLPAASASNITVYAPGVNVSTSEPAPVAVTKIIYDAKRYAQKKKGWDVAFLILSGPIGDTPITRLATTEESAAITANKASMKFVGYGQKSPAGTPGANTPASVPDLSTAQTYLWSYVRGPGAIDVAINGISGPCYGDSGGPWLYQLESELLLVGVESLGQGRPCDKNWEEPYEEVPVISGLKSLVAQAYAAAAVSQPQVPNTCLKVQGEKQSCEAGRVWIYFSCWTGSRGTLQKLEGGNWVDIQTRRAVREKEECGTKYPYGVTFSGSSIGPNLERYRIVFPKQQGVGRVTYEPFVITRK
jgi:hypothetical protein